MPIDRKYFEGWEQPMPEKGQRIAVFPYTSTKGFSKEDVFKGIVRLVWFGLEPVIEVQVEGEEKTRPCHVGLGDRWAPLT